MVVLIYRQFKIDWKLRQIRLLMKKKKTLVVGGNKTFKLFKEILYMKENSISGNLNFKNFNWNPWFAPYTNITKNSYCKTIGNFFTFKFIFLLVETEKITLISNNFKFMLKNIKITNSIKQVLNLIL